MVEKRRPAGEVFSREINPQLLYSCLFAELGRESIAHCEVLQAQISAVLEIPGIGTVKITAGNFRNVPACTGEICVCVIIVPYVLHEISPHERLHRIRIGSPERKAPPAAAPARRDKDR